MKYREIERLRALAILIVFNSHMADSVRPIPAAWLSAGIPGVTLFFVISGFVISRSLFRLLPAFEEGEPLLERLDRARAALRIFFAKRFFRIFPMALLWLLIPLGLSYLVHDQTLFGPPSLEWKEAFEILTLQYNYASIHHERFTLGVYWSLMVEEHFYLILPFFLICFHTWEKRLVAVTASLLVCALILRPLAPSPGPGIYQEQLHVLSHRNFDALFAGVLLAVFQKLGWGGSLAKLPRIAGSLLAAFCFFGLWIAPSVLPSGFAEQGGACVWILATILVFLATQDRGFVGEIPWLKAVMEYLGSRSYGIYLIHLPLKCLAVLIFENEHWVFTDWLASDDLGNRFCFTMLVLVPTLLLAELGYRLLERPMIVFGNRLVGCESSGSRGLVGLRSRPPLAEVTENELHTG